MSQDKTLDNTEISNKDAKELVQDNDTKLDSTATKKRSSSSRPKRKASSASKLSEGAVVPIDSGSPYQTTLLNIKNALSEPKNREEFIVNVADLLAQFSRRGLTVQEQKDLRTMVEDDLVTKVFKVQKQL